MRPHRLRVTAFGAFGGTAEVCFDDLASSGLFLLHGETGAGKTTLLDAMGFALYGRVPGERGKARRLRSDHAAAGAATEVQFEATIGGRRMRITRRPEQERPKRRGSGTTTEQAKILLEELADASWRAVSTRAGEADEEIRDLMGMSAEQFYQVVLLPQGEFARFLHADAADRAKLLAKLFGTDRFRAVEDWLAERRRATAREVEEDESGIRELVARIAQVAGVPADTAEVPSPEWAGQLARAAAAEAAAGAEQVLVRRAELDRAQDRQRDAERLADRQRRRADALRARDQLAREAAGIEELRGELGAALRAAEVIPAVEEAERTLAALAEARRAEERARAAAGCDATVAELRAGAQRHVTKSGALEALRSLSEQAAGEDETAASARRAAVALAAQVGAAVAEAAAGRERRPELSLQRDRAREAAERLPGVQAEADRHHRAADDMEALIEARADASRQEEAYFAAKMEYLELFEEASRLRRARIDGMRAELAATLVDGAPCPVCGSLDHPELCELRGERVTREQEEAADAEAAAASDRAETIGARLGAADERVAALSGRLHSAGFLVAADRPTAEAEAKRLKATWRELAAEAARLAAIRLPAAQAELEDLDGEIAAAEKRLAELTKQHESELRLAAEADQRAARLRESLAAQLDGAPDLDTALASEHAMAEALTAAADAADAAARAQADTHRAADLAAKAATEAGFASPDEARQAYRSTDWRVAADRGIRDHEAKTEAVTALLADPELDVPLDPPADTEGTTTAAEAAREQLDEAVAAYDRARHRADQLADLAPQLGARLDGHAPLAARAAEVRRLADLAAGLGPNTLRMTLSSFVLAARLEEVAAAASERLGRMTSGRYSLVHTDARRGAGRSGLGLLACDSWTGVDRDTSTLSGGETFLASLALALGLADVVTAEAGGTRIEALFVDEGFGSLDEETLEEVMTVLDGLREGGRMVGIVSHVPELRQRIPAQLRVHKGRAGSHLTVRKSFLCRTDIGACYRGNLDVRCGTTHHGEMRAIAWWGSLSRRRRMLLAAASLAVVAGAIASVALSLAGSAPVPAARDNRPGDVLLVPGYGGSTTALDALASRIRAAGGTPTVVHLTGNGTGDLQVQANVLNGYVNQALAAGSGPVTVIGYSAGGVVAWLWDVTYDGKVKARQIITLGSPLHGAQLAALGAADLPDECPAACQELVPGSAMLTRLQGTAAATRPPWLSLWTTDDQVVQPPDSARLPGAVNVPLQSVCPGVTIAHGQLPTAPLVVGIVLRTLHGTGPSPPRPSDCRSLQSLGSPQP